MSAVVCDEPGRAIPYAIFLTITPADENVRRNDVLKFTLMTYRQIPKPD